MKISRSHEPMGAEGERWRRGACVEEGRGSPAPNLHPPCGGRTDASPTRPYPRQRLGQHAVLPLPRCKLPPEGIFPSANRQPP